MQRIHIDRLQFDAEVKLARITAQLAREGVTFEVYERGEFYAIDLLGGY